MQNFNFICIQCKTTRRYIYWGKPKCPQCKKPMKSAGYIKLKPPKKKDHKGWNLFANMLRKELRWHNTDMRDYDCREYNAIKLIRKFNLRKTK